MPKVNFSRPSSYPWYTSTANFTLPLSAELLFLHALGLNYDGHLYVVVDNSASLTKKSIDVGIEAIFHRVGLRDTILVSDMTRGKARGVGVYGCEEDCPSDEMHALVVYIHVRVPRQAKLPGLEIETKAVPTSWHADKDGQLAVESLQVNSRLGSFTSDVSGRSLAQKEQAPF